MANKQFTRADRVAQQIQRDLATVIRAELDHPQASLITLTDVEVTRDYSHAKVFYTFMGDEALRAEIAALLERAKGFLRAQISRGISLYKMPELHFEYDVSIEYGMNLAQKIKEANALPTALESAPDEDGEA